MSQPKVANLICFAVDQEAAPFRGFANQRDDIRVLVVGIGRRNAERSLRHALDSVVPSRVITAGFAGGLNPARPPYSVPMERSGQAEGLTGIGSGFPLSDDGPAEAQL